MQHRQKRLNPIELMVAVLAILVLAYIILGCFMEGLAIMVLTIPIVYPLVLDMGFDPIWFGVIIVLVTQMGVSTPPVGINVYVVYGVAKSVTGGVPLEAIFKGNIDQFSLR